MVLLEQLAKLLNGQAGVAHDPAERVRVDRVVTRDGQDACAVRHDDVLALADDLEPRLLESSHGIEVVDAGDPGHGQTATSISRISSP